MNYKDLNVYQRAYQAAINLHVHLQSKKSATPPQQADELKYLAREILANIAEGFNARTPKSKRFLYFRALDSIRRLMMDLDFMVDLHLIPQKEHKTFADEYEICAKQLFKLGQSVISAKSGSASSVKPDVQKTETAVSK